jgi:hypothetical protein
VDLVCTKQNNNFLFYSKDSTYYQGKIILQQIERAGFKKIQALGPGRKLFSQKKKYGEKSLPVIGLNEENLFL